MKQQKEKIILLVSFVVFVFSSVATAQTKIYRSVQVNKTAAIATNALGSLTISGSTATFSAAMPDTLGVGDAIVYNASLSICFIHGRTSSTVYTVKSASGGTPTAIITDIGWNAYRAYVQPGEWESGTENTGIPAGVRNFDAGNRNLVSNNEQWHVAFYRSTTAEVQVTTQGWVTDPTTNNYIRWFTPYDPTEVGTTQRHRGTLTQPYFSFNGNLNISGGGGVADALWGFKVEGFILVMTAVFCNNIQLTDMTAPSVIEISDCVFIGRNGSGCSGTTSGIQVATDFFGTLKVKNCIFYNYDGSGNNSGAGSHAAIYYVATASTGTVYAYNVTDFNSNYSFRHEGASGTFVVKNCISNDSDTFGFYTAGGSAFHTDSDYNLSDRASPDAPGTHSKRSRNVAFVSEGSNNFHLASTDTTAGNSGVDLSADANLAVTTDIDRDARPTPSYVDMGADEGVASPPQSGTYRRQSFGQFPFGHRRR